jgi:hypothetical protein
MDETAVRDLLELVASDEAPVSSVDLDLVRSRGRRRRRLWRVYLPGAAPVAAAAAVAVIAALSAGLPQAPPTKPQASPTAPAQATRPDGPGTAPTQFDLLRPYASFGWLPAGFSAAGLINEVSQSSAELTMTASAPAEDGRYLMLTVDAAGACRLTGPQSLTYLGTRYQFPHGLTCGGTGQHGGGLPVSDSRLAVNGAPAYWTALHGGLVWQYAPGAWAILSPDPNPAVCVHCSQHPELTGWYETPAKDGHPTSAQSAASRRLLIKIAASIRFGISPVVRYGFTITGLPVSWQPDRAGAAAAGFAEIGGELITTAWSAGPADDPDALSVLVQPAGLPGSYGCNFVAGQSSYVTIDGVQMMRRSIDQPGKHEQYLCAAGVAGLQIYLALDLSVPGSVDTPLPGGQAVGSVLAVFSHLHLLGPDVRQWTTRQP